MFIPLGQIFFIHIDRKTNIFRTQVGGGHFSYKGGLSGKQGGEANIFYTLCGTRIFMMIIVIERRHDP